jgi:hypothetical protein
LVSREDERGMVMVKVQLPKVEEETRAELNVIKARRKDKDLNKTLVYLVSLDKQQYSPEFVTIVLETETLDKLKTLDVENNSWDELLNVLMDKLNNRD